MPPVGYIPYNPLNNWQKYQNITKIIMDSQLLRVISDTVNSSFRKPQPQHVTLGQYTISTTGTNGHYPFFFTLTVASEDMSVDFGIWQSGTFGQKFRPIVNQANFMAFSRKYDSFRQQVSDIDRCLRLMWVEI